MCMIMVIEELALLKAKDIADMNEKKSLVVVGADTVVAHDGKILGKPKSEQDAFDMIKGYQGDKHQVRICRQLETVYP